ncbi:MAG: YafY family transcriptional regulator [Spirochaetales bacterium]|nr:YafY family transcriptional regulator [Spirochaetales bacterium]
MKIDRLLSIIVYLLNRDLVSAKTLSERFGVSVRTIQRDMETIDLAGIPIFTVQGPNGGYGIMDTYKMDRRLVTVDDLYYIITALGSIGSSLEDRRLGDTLEKMKGLVPAGLKNPFREKQEKLYVDFSMLGGGPEQREIFKAVQNAVETGRLLRFTYTNNRMEKILRVVEPMTVVFKWRSWYLFAYCKNRKDYRIFRISRMRDPEILSDRFHRRPLTFEDFSRDFDPEKTGKFLEIKLKFSPEVVPLVEEFYNQEDLEKTDDGYLLARTRMPEDGWLYGYILSYGSYVEVLEPERLRGIVKDIARATARLYD